MKNRKISGAVTGIALICAVIMTCLIMGCELQGEKPPDPEPPSFTSEPTGQSVGPGGWVDLIAEATSPDGGTITFEWYQVIAGPDGDYEELKGTRIYDGEGGTLSLQLPEEEGVYLYYVVAVNTNNGRTNTLTSNIIIITVEDPNSPLKYPIIKQQPVNSRVMVGEVELKIEAEQTEGDEGTLTYQWYSSTGTGNKDGAKIDGATGNASTIDIGAPGEYNFYCVVSSVIYGPVDDTNRPTIAQSKSITSQTATITVIAELIPNAYVAINPNRKYQYVRGFGGMGDSFNGNVIMKTTDEYETLFNPDKLGYNMLRIMIMPENPRDNTDVKLTNEYYVSGLDGQVPDVPYPLYYEGVKIVNKYGGYVLASPWSPPPEWKTNNSKNGGGHLIKSYYQDYANYLRDFCQDMYDHGAPIFAISIQNEPNFMASYDGCEWEPEDMRDFFLEVGHFTEFPTAIPGYGGGKEIPYVYTMNGESANHPNINDRAMDNATSRAAIDVLGRHTYGDALLRYAKALDVEPKKEVWMTEHNINSGNAIAYPNDSTWNYVWLFLNDVDLSIRQNDESAFIWWYIRRFYSAIGDGTYGTKEGVPYPRGYGLSHYAKYAKEMWRCGVSVTGSTAGEQPIDTSNCNPVVLSRTTNHVRATAFVSEDGNTISLVMYTPTDTSGKNGFDMGTVKIDLPRGFIVDKADAMRSTAAARAKKESVMLTSDKTSALVMLPPSTILSVRFTKAN